ncbi:MAG: PAS domain S-box protein [Deltaproteobacteria bacterium]|nr:PAS domain S-box protein [Deltaproteobacteria bacterium]
MDMSDRKNVSLVEEFVEESRIKACRVPVLVGALLCTCVFVLWWALDQREQADLSGRVQSEARVLTAYIDGDLRNRVASLQRMAMEWEMRGGIPEAEFNKEALVQLSGAHRFQALEWADRSLRVRRVVPPEGNERALNLKVTFEEKREAALEDAKVPRVPIMTPPTDLVQGGKGFWVYFPVFSRNEFDGFLLAVFRAQEWLDHVFGIREHGAAADDFKISVSLEGVRVYEEEGWAAQRSYGLDAVSEAKILDRRISVHVRPTDSFVAGGKTVLPKLTALAGTLLAVLISLVVHLYRKRSSEVRRTLAVKAALENEIREHEKSAEELQSAMSRLDLATKAGGIGVWTWDVSTGVLTWNERMFNLYDIPPDAVPTYQTWSNAVHPDDLPATESLLKSAVEGRAVFDTEFRIVLTGGAVRYLGAAARVERDPTGKPQRVTGISWDLTGRRNAEETLKRSEEQVRLLLNSTAEAIYGIDLKGDCTFANPSCLRMLGYAEMQQLLGRNMHRQIHHSHPDGTPMAMEECSIYRSFREGAGVHRDDEVLWRADGSSFPVEYWSYPQRVNGVVSGAVVTFVDITERKQAEKALRESRQQFQGLVETLYDWVWEVDSRGHYTYVSPQIRNILGYEPEEILGKTPYDLMAPAEAEKVSNIFGALIQERSPIVTLENINIHRDGHRVVIETNGLAFYDADGNFKGYRGTDRDITERKRAQELLAAERRRMANILEGTNVGTWEWNVQTGETIFNERWAELIGYTLAELAPLSIETWTKFGHPEDLKASQELLERHFRKELPYYECEARMRHKNGSWVWVLDRGKVATWTADGKPLIMSGTHQDITARKLAEERIHHMATHDLLTDLPSLRLAKDRLSMAIGSAHRHETAVAAMFIDLDGFKAVNDTHGHDAGDEVLRQVAKRLLSCVRETDTVARVGGDEFLLVTTDLCSLDNAAQIAEKVVHLLSRPVVVNGQEAAVGVSIGIAHYPGNGGDVDRLIKLADEAMYRVKNTGKQGYAFAVGSSEVLKQRTRQSP